MERTTRTFLDRYRPEQTADERAVEVARVAGLVAAVEAAAGRFAPIDESAV